MISININIITIGTALILAFEETFLTGFETAKAFVLDFVVFFLPVDLLPVFLVVLLLFFAVLLEVFFLTVLVETLESFVSLISSLTSFSVLFILASFNYFFICFLLEIKTITVNIIVKITNKITFATI